jgi:hypothetical protein
MNPANYQADIERICCEALANAGYRPLTNDEIAALRWAAGIAEGAPRPVDSGQGEFKWQ